MQIPSLVVYHKGTLKACGAEALEYVDDDDHEVAKWFKVRCVHATMNDPNVITWIVEPSSRLDEDISQATRI